MGSPAVSPTRPEIHPLLRDRWSPRAFQPAHVLADAELATLFEAARWSPSAGNSQPWSFIVGQRGDQTFDAFFATLSRGNTSWAGSASALVLTLRQTATGPDHELPFSDYAAYDLGGAAAHLTIQAQSLGLHVHQFAGFDHDAAAAAFQVPAHWSVMTGIAIGKLAPADGLPEALQIKERAERVRRPLDEIVFRGAWGKSAELG